MISIESERTLLEILLLLSEEERSINICREKLSRDSNFNSFDLFKSIDREGKGCLMPEDLIYFLKQFDVVISFDQAKMLVFPYDQDRSQSLNYREFTYMCVPPRDRSLLRLSLERQLYESPLNPKYVPHQSKFNLARLLTREVELGKKTSELVKLLSTNYDFDIFSLYSTIDVYGFNFITKDAIYKFASKHGIDLINSEIEDIFNRLDTDKDEKIEFFEFKSFINNYHIDKSNIYNKYSKNINSLGTYLSIDFIKSNSNRKEIPKNLKKSTSLELDLFIKTVDMMTSYYAEIEEIRRDLSLRRDFSLKDAFRMFEMEERGYVCDADFKFVLKELGIYPSLEEINVLIKTYSNGRDLILSFKEFSKLFLPFDDELSTKLRMKATVGCFPPESWLSRLLPDSVVLLGKLFRLLLEAEAQFESAKQRWTETTFFDAKALFDELAGGQKLTRDLLINILRENEKRVSNEDVEWLFGRLDRNNLGEVNWIDFCEEVRPQSSFYFP